MATHTEQLTPLRTEPTVQLRGLTRSFDGRTVLDGIDLDLPAGQFTALLGHSGSGKSTLLRAIAGLDHSVTGSGQLSAPERVSVVFQDSRLLPWRRVLDNVLLGTDGKEAERKGRSALAEVGLMRPRTGLAERTVRRRGPACRAGPFARTGARTAPRRRAVRRAGRAHPDPDACPAARAVGAAPALRPARHARRGRGDRAGRPGARARPGAYRPRPDHRTPHPRSYRDPLLGEYRERLLAALGVTEDHK